MKTNILAGLIIAAGSIWALQGSGVLPGSVMSGESFWLYAGILMIVAGIALLIYKNRKKPDSGES